MSKMKRFILYTVIFLSIIVAIDMTLGHSFSYLSKHAKGGETARSNYICNQTSEDILIFGSSRASHHYNSQIIEDSTKFTCFNCGQMGNGIILNYGRLLMILERYQPKMIIYDVTTGYDMNIGEDNHKYLGWLSPYYDHPGIKEIFQSVDKNSKYKMASRMFRNNSRFLNYTVAFFRPIQDTDIKGYQPMPPKKPSKVIPVGKPSEKDFVIDTLKIEYLKKFVQKCKDTKLVFAISPIWNGMSEKAMKPVMDFCKENDIELWNYANDSSYVHHQELFSDGSHLSPEGADKYTLDIIPRIREALE